MKDTNGPDHRWAIILAAGEGTRLAAVTAKVHGRPIPKQFAAICGDRTFIQRTVDRILPLVPASRTVVVVAAAHEEIARAQLAEFGGLEIVVQPRNRGTGAGVLLPLAHVLARDPKADVVILPSDHHVERPAALRSAVSRAFAASRDIDGGAVLIGAAAESAATDLGWILGTDAHTSGPRMVDHFVEKPSAPAARELLADGGLWNTLIIASGAQSLWQLGRRHVPEVARALEIYRPWIGRKPAADVLNVVYANLPASDISRDVLQSAKGLGVVAMVDAGWSDCGTPERLRQVLASRSAGASSLQRGGFDRSASSAVVVA